jgi:hypothetical protein
MHQGEDVRTRRRTGLFAILDRVPDNPKKSETNSMARFTDVANSSLCPIKNNLIQTYIDFVEVFATKYANKTTITIPSNAAKWEGHVSEGTYRLDLQGAEGGYGNIQAQFGVGHKNCKEGGSYGGVRLVCDTPFSIADVQTGLERSLRTGNLLVQLDIDDQPIDIVPPSKASKNKPGKKPWTPGTTY